MRPKIASQGSLSECIMHLGAQIQSIGRWHTVDGSVWCILEVVVWMEGFWGEQRTDRQFLHCSLVDSVFSPLCPTVATVTSPQSSPTCTTPDSTACLRDSRLPTMELELDTQVRLPGVCYYFCEDSKCMCAIGGKSLLLN